ncbi:hypothetical protein K466DRAFT_605301 [Polyporus arcularius HHB13444]|uniref:Uncharacterized protein n=1 Tax=Polyporus arcularius HHB13444 TaxID=1314778 RepID=A0A5C3NTZ7_9APHY|nr:hypothetical protein K466DRAFT_605301 [Polyporus arcularius HHB13444]
MPVNPSDHAENSGRTAEERFRCFGEWVRTLFVLADCCHVLPPPDQVGYDACPECVRWSLSGRGLIHIHLPVQYNDSDDDGSSYRSATSPPSGQSPPEEDVSPGSTLAPNASTSIDTQGRGASHQEVPRSSYVGLVEALATIASLPEDSNAHLPRLRPDHRVVVVDSSLEHHDDSISFTTESSSDSLFSNSENAREIDLSPDDGDSEAIDMVPVDGLDPAHIASAPSSHRAAASFVAGQPRVLAQLDPVASVHPYAPFVSPESDAKKWYIVTKGRIVGVFDNSSMVDYSVCNIGGGSGCGGYPSRAKAIKAFQTAEAAGIVLQIATE